MTQGKHKWSVIQPVATVGERNLIPQGGGSIWEPAWNTSVIPAEGHGSSGLCAINMGGHCFGDTPGGIDFKHYWTIGYGCTFLSSG